MHLLVWGLLLVKCVFFPCLFFFPPVRCWNWHAKFWPSVDEKFYQANAPGSLAHNYPFPHGRWWLRGWLQVSWQAAQRRSFWVPSLLIQAVFMYWLSSNMFSLGQVACLRIPAVRTVLKIPQRVVHDPDKLPPREGFIKSFKQGKGPSSVTRTGGTYQILKRSQENSSTFSENRLLHLSEIFLGK